MAKGQSIAEYVLAGGLVGLVALGGVMAISDGLTNSMQGLSNRFGPAGNTAAATGGGGPATPATTTAISPTLGTTASAYPTSAAGFEQMMNDLPNLIETSGGSGTTKELMAYLSSLGNELLANEEITPEQHNMLQELSNQGHYMARIQEAVELTYESADPNMHLVELTEQPVTLDTETKTISQWLQELNVNGDVDNSTNIENLYKDPGANLNQTFKFNELYMKAKQSGAMNNPSVASVVDRLSNSVINISNTFNAGYRSNKSSITNDTGTDGLAVTVGKRLEAVKPKIKGSLATDANSAGICETGGGNDSGTLCG